MRHCGSGRCAVGCRNVSWLLSRECNPLVVGRRFSVIRLSSCPWAMSAVAVALEMGRSDAGVAGDPRVAPTDQGRFTVGAMRASPAPPPRSLATVGPPHRWDRSSRRRRARRLSRQLLVVQVTIVVNPSLGRETIGASTEDR